MSDFDLDRLGDLWRAPPDPAELDQIRRSAETVRRQSRWGLITDYGLAAFVSTVVFILLLSNPRLETGIFGGVVILLMLFTTVRQRRLREAELRMLTGSTEQMLEQTESRLRATVARARFNLWGAAPAVLLGIGFGWTLDRGAGSPLLTRFSASPATGLIVTAVIALLAALSLVHFGYALARARAELCQIIRLRDDFQSEADLSAGGDDEAV